MNDRLEFAWRPGKNQLVYSPFKLKAPVQFHLTDFGSERPICHVALASVCSNMFGSATCRNLAGKIFRDFSPVDVLAHFYTVL